MACKQNSSLFSAFLLLVLLSSMTVSTFAARHIATTDKSTPKPDNVALTTQNFPDIGEPKRLPQLPHSNIGAPLSEYHQYIPGLDDNIVENPGYEVPNPFAAGHDSASASSPAAHP